MRVEVEGLSVVFCSLNLMAEIIQGRIEDRLAELEQLERIGLFSRAEIK